MRFARLPADVADLSVKGADPHSIQPTHAKRLDGILSGSQFTEKPHNLLEQNERGIRAAKRQALASERSLELTREIVYVSERAYIEVEYVWFDPPLEAGVLSSLCWSIKNTYIAQKLHGAQVSPILHKNRSRWRFAPSMKHDKLSYHVWRSRSSHKPTRPA